MNRLSEPFRTKDARIYTLLENGLQFLCNLLKRDVAEKLVPDFLMGAGQVIMTSLMLR